MNLFTRANLFQLLEYISIVTCFGIFVSQALVFFNLYLQEAIISGSQIVRNGILNHPSVTVCPYTIHKSTEYPMTMEEFMKYSYKWEDFFSNDSIVGFQNKSLWDNVVSHGPYIGTCFTLNLKSAPSVFSPDFLIYFLPNITFLMFIHDPGEEFWLFIREFPFDVPNVMVNLNPPFGNGIAELRIFEKRFRRYSSQHRPCKHGIDTRDFLKCVNETAIRILKNENLLQCRGVFTDNFHNFHLPLCQTIDEAKKSCRAVEEVLINLMTNATNMGCPIPCDRKYYQVTFTQSGEQFFTSFSMKNNSVHFFVFYDSIDSEVITETLAADFNTLLSSVGGNLGLFLGFSCLTSILSFISFIKNKFT